MPVTLFEHVQDQWKNHDKEWVTCRKNQWAQIVKRLQLVPDWISAPEIGNLKSYFISGEEAFTLNYYDGKRCVGLNPHWYLREVVLQLWFYPGEIKNFDLKLSEGYAVQWNYHRKRLFDVFGTMHRNIKPSDSDYGLMNGREGIVSLCLNPGVDYLNTHDFGNDTFGGSCLAPKDLFSICIGGTTYELTNFSKKNRYTTLNPNASYVRNTSGLVLWNHFDFAFGKYKEELFGIKPNGSDRRERLERFENRVDVLLGELLVFFDRPKDDEARQRKKTVEFVENLVTRYEKKEYSPALMERWDQAKKSI